MGVDERENLLDLVELGLPVLPLLEVDERDRRIRVHEDGVRTGLTIGHEAERLDEAEEVIEADVTGIVPDRIEDASRASSSP